MTISFTMISPGASPNVNFTNNLTGNSYTSNAAGLATILSQDANAAEAAGWTPYAQKSVQTLALSTAAGVYVQQGAMNLIPVSTIAAVALLAAPVTVGQTTNLAALSTGNFVITASGATILDQKGAACTVLTCNTGTMDLMAVGSTSYQILNRSLLSNSSNAVVFGIGSS